MDEGSGRYYSSGQRGAGLVGLCERKDVVSRKPLMSLRQTHVARLVGL